MEHTRIYQQAIVISRAPTLAERDLIGFFLGAGSPKSSKLRVGSDCMRRNRNCYKFVVVGPSRLRSSWEGAAAVTVTDRDGGGSM